MTVVSLSPQRRNLTVSASLILNDLTELLTVFRWICVLRNCGSEFT